MTLELFNSLARSPENLVIVFIKLYESAQIIVRVTIKSSIFIGISLLITRNLFKRRKKGQK